MNTKDDQCLVNNPNPVLNVANDGTVLYSNEAAGPLLNMWGVRVGNKLPLNIRETVQRVILKKTQYK